MSKQEKLANLAGAGKNEALRVTFDRRFKLEFHGSQVTSDAELLAYRELDEALRLTSSEEDLLSDWRTGHNNPTFNDRDVAAIPLLPVGGQGATAHHT
jgi:hypothetical protein